MSFSESNNKKRIWSYVIMGTIYHDGFCNIFLIVSEQGLSGLLFLLFLHIAQENFTQRNE